MITLVPLVILALASFRITRLLVIDTLLASSRNKFHTVLINRTQKDNKFFHFFWEKFYELTSCTWCAGFWVSAIIYWIYAWNSPLLWSRLDVINIFAISAIQSLLHAFEPDDA